MERREMDEKIKRVVEKIVKEFDPERVILFGSWAWGNPGPDSDVDFFVLKDTSNTRELARKIDGAFFPRPFPMDLIVYRPEQLEKRKQMGDPFVNDILTNGQVLYAR